MSTKYCNKLFVFEGIDNAGKSTQIDLVHKKLTTLGLDVVKERAPFNTLVRKMLSENRDLTFDERLILILFDRSIHNRIILDHISKNKVVLLDRYIASTYAYQGAENDKLSMDNLIENMKSFNIDLLKPRSNFYFDVTAEESQSRDTSDNTDYFDKKSLEFKRTLIDRYKEYYSKYDKDVINIDATNDKSEITEFITDTILTFIWG